MMPKLRQAMNLMLISRRYQKSQGVHIVKTDIII